MISGKQHIESCCVLHGCAWKTDSVCPVVVGIVMQAHNPCTISDNFWPLCSVNAELGKVEAIKALRTASKNKAEYSYPSKHPYDENSKTYMSLALTKALVEELKKVGIVLMQKKIPLEEPEAPEEPEADGSPPEGYSPLTKEEWEAITGSPLVPSYVG